MTKNPSDPNRRPEAVHGAHAPQGQDSAAKQKAAETASEAQGQAKAVAQEAKGHAQDLAQTAQAQAADVKDEAVQQVKSLAGSLQEQVGSQAGTQQERLALHARGLTDDLHRVLSGEQPQTDTLRQAVSTLADRAESLTQRLETAEPADLLRDVRGFAARKPGTFLAVALGLGMVAGRLTRGMRDAAHDTTPAPRYAQVPAGRREMEPLGVQSDVTPHHIESTIPAHTGDAAPRLDAATGVPFDQTQPGGRA